MIVPAELIEKINFLRETTLKELSRERVYYEITFRYWGDLYFSREMAFLGQYFQSFIDKFTEPELTSQSFIDGYLSPHSFIEQQSIFESFFFDFLKLWFQTFPQRLSNKILQIRVGDYLEDKEKDFLDFAIDHELNELKYQSVRNWFKYLKDWLGIEINEELYEMLIELRSLRDILTHAGGIINETYVRKAGKRARYDVNDYCIITPQIIDESRQIVGSVLNQITEQGLQKTI